MKSWCWFESFRRVVVVTRLTIREAARQRSLAGLLLGALLLVMGARAVAIFNFGAPELKFIADLGLGAIGFFGAILTVVLVAQLFFSELEQRTVLTLLARPMSRTEFIAGKFFGAMAVVIMFVGTLTLLLTVVLWAREEALLRAGVSSGPLVNYGWLTATAWLLGWKLAVLGAMTLMVASYASSQLLAVGSGLGLFVAAHLQPLVRAAAQRATSGWESGLARGVGWLVPDFQWFALGTDGAWSWPQVARVTVYASGYVVLAGILAGYAFRRREL